MNLEDRRLVDAARLLLFAWPQGMGAGFPLSPGPLFRNQLAWAVFEAEAGLAIDDALPWEEFGVPLALIGLDGDLRPTFVDRAAVVRRGGLDRHNRLGRLAENGLVESWRLAGLWQARIEQLAGHLWDLAGAPDQGAMVEAVNGAIEHWPPCGVLPRWSVDLEASRAELFPAAFVIDAVPVPVEQLDLIIRETAGLAPLVESRPERVQLLVPVPQAVYDPRLLHSEEIDPLFRDTLDRFLLDRARALATRHTLSSRHAVLVRAIEGKQEVFTAIGADPLAPEPEALPGWPLPSGANGRRLGPQPGWISRHFRSDAPFNRLATEAAFLWICLDPDRPPRTLALQWRSKEGEATLIWGTQRLPPSSRRTPPGSPWATRLRRAGGCGWRCPPRCCRRARP